ncbi:terpene synthase family protein [Streptomyces coelicoflavus]|uniref:terpene synthase family protein n=1 Tax=Streptomyces coelicoflavus TaxID=285562 RepID=UPI0036808FBB
MRKLVDQTPAIGATGVSLPYEVRVNPHLEVSREEHEIWARDMGMLRIGPPLSEGVWKSDQLRMIAVPELAAKIAPDAKSADLVLINHALVWIFAYDDYFTSAFKKRHDRKGGWAYARRLCTFIHANPRHPVPEPADAVERGLADLWPRLAQGRSFRWRRDFSRVIHEFLTGAALELENICDDRVPDLIDFIGLRRRTFAGGTGSCITAMATGTDIPEALRETEVVTQLLDAFIDVMALGNEAVSYEMEINDEGEINNLMLVLRDISGGDLDQAQKIATGLIEDRVRHFEHLVEVKLPRLAAEVCLSPSEVEQMRVWVRGAQSYLSGLYDWYDNTLRYRGNFHGA